jgi:hypothetical protein
MHLFRGSSLHILCLLVLTSLARIHVCSSSVRHLNIFIYTLHLNKSYGKGVGYEQAT